MDALTVSVRLRPISQRERSTGLRALWGHTDKTVFQQPDQNGPCFSFDHVFGPETSNAEVYEKLMKDIVSQTMEGFHGTFITYGQSGSGKTYTTDALASLAIENIYGHIENVLHHGLWIAIKEEMEAMCPDREFLVRFSYIELYNERLNDLLGTDEVPLVIREDLDRNISIDGLVEEGIRSKEDAMYLLVKGSERRRFAETKLNERSSRAHCIIRIVIESKELMDAENSSVFVSHLHLVDLAGSERAAENNGDRFREGCSINKSLLALSLVIRKLSEDQSNVHVNHRDSKLTRILQNALGGNSRTAIICTISPCSVEETLSTLRFATNAKKVKNKPHQNEIMTDAAMMKKLKKEISRLNKKISEMEEGPNASVELEKKHQEVRNLKSLLLVSSKDTNQFKEDRRRRETVCIPQMSRYNRFQPIKGLLCTPLKAIEEKSRVIDSDLRRSHMNVKQLPEHRLESPCATTSCECHDLSFAEYEKCFIGDYAQERIKGLERKIRELELLLHRRDVNASNVMHDFRSNDLISHDEEPEKFEDATNISFRLEQNQSFSIQSNITVRNRRKLQAYTPGNSTSVLFGSSETDFNSEQGSEAGDISRRSMINLDGKGDQEELMNGSLLINQGQPMMDVSTMCLNQSLLFPKPSRIVDENEMKGNKAQSPQRLFDSFEKETEFVEKFESLMEENLSLKQKVFDLEHQLSVQSADQVSREGVDECQKQSQSPSEGGLGEREGRIDVVKEFKEEERRNEIEAEKEELGRRAEDLRLQEERIERKIDLLCEKEEVIEDRLIAVESKEKDLEEKEADFLRLELELNRKKRDFERLHIEEAKVKEDIKHYSVNETCAKEDDLNAADFKKMEEELFVNMEEANINEYIPNPSLDERITSEDNSKTSDFEKLDDELMKRKQEMEAERMALETKAADLRMREEEIHRIKTDVEAEYAKLEIISSDIKTQGEELNNYKYEVDMEKEELRKKTEDLRQLENEMNEREQGFEKRRMALEQLESSLKCQREKIAEEIREKKEVIVEVTLDSKKSIENIQTVAHERDDEREDFEEKLRKYIEMEKVSDEQITDLQKEKDNLVKENDKYKEMLSDFERLQAREQQEGKVDTKDQKCLEDKLRSYMEMAQASDEQITDLQKEKDNLVKENDKYKEMLSDFERLQESEQHKCLEEELRKYMEMAKASDEQIDDLQKENHNLVMENDKYKERLSDFERLQAGDQQEGKVDTKDHKCLEEELRKYMEMAHASDEQITDLQKEKDNLEKEKDKYKEMLSDFERFQASDQQEGEVDTKDHKCLKEELRKYIEMAQASDEQIIDLQKEKDNLEKENDKYKEMLSNFEKLQASDQHKCSEEELRKYIEMAQASDEQITDLQKENDNLVKENDKYKEMLSDFERLQAREQQEGKVDTKDQKCLEDKLRSYMEMAQASDEQITDLQKEKDNLVKENDKYKEMLSDFERFQTSDQQKCIEEELRQYMEMAKASDEQINDLQKENHNLVMENDKYKEMLSEFERFQSREQQEGIDETKDQENLYLEKADLERQIEKIHTEKDFVEAEKRKLVEMKADFERQIHELQEEKDVLGEKQRHMDEISADLDRQRVELHNECEKMKEKEGRLNELMLDFEGQKNELLKEKNEIMEEKQEFEKRTSDFGRLKEDLDREQKGFEEEKRNLAERQKVLHQQVDDFSKEKKDMEEERRKFSEMQEDLRQQEEQLQKKNEEIERMKEELEGMTEDVRRQKEEGSRECSGEVRDGEQQPLDESNSSRKEEDMAARIARLEYIIEKGKGILSQKNQKLAESQENMNVLKSRVEELNEKNKQLEEKHSADIKEYEAAIQRLQTEQDRVVKEEVENCVKMKESSDIEQVNALTRKVEILERKNKKLEIKYREDIEYYRLLFEKQKLKMRQVQDLGASYMEPAMPSSSSEDALNEELSQLKEQHCDLQAKYSADVTRYREAINRLKLENEKALAVAREHMDSKRTEVQQIAVNEFTPANEEDQVQALVRRVQILEREKKKLETKNHEDIEYYTLALEKYKRMMRERQDLGASYLEPSTANSRSQITSNNDWIHTKLKQLQDEHKDLQAKYTAEVSQYEQTIQRLREEKHKDIEHSKDRRPLQMLQQEQRVPPVASSGGIVDYVVMLNKEREIKKLRKQLEKCHCKMEST